MTDDDSDDCLMMTAGNISPDATARNRHYHRHRHTYVTICVFVCVLRRKCEEIKQLNQ